MNEEDNCLYEENFVLEVCESVDVDSIPELRYSLAAISSGMSDSYYFNVKSGQDTIAFIMYEDDIFKMTLFNKSGDSKEYFTDNIDEAFSKIVDSDFFYEDDLCVATSRHETIISIIQRLYHLQNADFENINDDDTLLKIENKLKEATELLDG